MGAAAGAGAAAGVAGAGGCAEAWIGSAMEPERARAARAARGLENEREVDEREVNEREVDEREVIGLVFPLGWSLAGGLVGGGLGGARRVGRGAVVRGCERLHGSWNGGGDIVVDAVEQRFVGDGVW